MTFRPRSIFANYGFSSYPDAAGNWLPTPLIQYQGESVLRNPLNGAVYGSADEANAAVGEHRVTVFASPAAWSTYLASFNGDVYAALLNPQMTQLPAQSLADQYPDLATIVRHFYQRYLNRTGAAVDPSGENYWIQVIINDGSAGRANAETAFRVQAVNDGLFTESTLPAPEYFSLGDDVVDETGDDTSTDDEVVDDTTDDTATDDDGGVLGGIQSAIGGIFDQLEETTGISRNYLQIGAVGLGIAALVYFNSDSTSTRKR